MDWYTARSSMNIGSQPVSFQTQLKRPDSHSHPCVPWPLPSHGARTVLQFGAWLFAKG